MSEAAGASRLAGIEVGRGVAASVVVLYHAARHVNKAYGAPMLTSIFQFGHAGVDFFFVISGFIILYVHYRDIGTPARLGHYISRRFTRVMPTYWVALAVTVLIGASGRHVLPSLTDLGWSVSLLPSNSELLLSVAWTLRYELVFYAVFCVLILHRVAGLSILALWLVWIVATAMGDVSGGFIPNSLYDTYNLEFFFGMAAAYTLRNHRVPAPKAMLALGLALFALVAVAEDFDLLDAYAAPARLAYGFPAALIVLGSAEAARQNRMTVPPLLRVLGSASYSIYLFQFVFIAVAWKGWRGLGLDQWAPQLACFALLATAGIAGGVLMSRWVEYPLIRLVRGRRPRVQPGTAIG